MLGLEDALHGPVLALADGDGEHRLREVDDGLARLVQHLREVRRVADAAAQSGDVHVEGLRGFGDVAELGAEAFGDEGVGNNL